MLLRSTDLRSYDQESAPPVNMAPVPALSVKGTPVFKVGRHGTDLAELLPALIPDHYYHIPSKGAFSLHEMVAYLAWRTGPCTMYLTSYGVSAEPLAQVFEMCRDGRIKKLRLFLDSRVPRECPEAHQLCLSPPDNAIVRFGKNHSKLVVMANGSRALMMQTSANLTNNPRLESYIISTNAQAARFTASFIRDLMDLDEEETSFDMP